MVRTQDCVKHERAQCAPDSSLRWHYRGVASTYHVTVSTGTCRSVPWPFGLFEVSDTGLCMRSWHWAWWVREQRIPRQAVGTIKATDRFGVLCLKFDVVGSKTVTLRLAINRRTLVLDLKRRGYSMG